MLEVVSSDIGSLTQNDNSVSLSTYAAFPAEYCFLFLFQISSCHSFALQLMFFCPVRFPLVIYSRDIGIAKQSQYLLHLPNCPGNGGQWAPS